jgi:hypothetical protein
MTSPDHDEQFLDTLLRLTRVLDEGDWRTAMQALGLDPGDDAQQDPDLNRAGRAPLPESDPVRVAELLSCLRAVTLSMRSQCAAGDVETASDELDKAVKVLRRRVRAFPRLGAEPARDRRLARLAWATCRVVLRERAELDAVRSIFVDLSPGRAEMVYAWVEYFTWVEFDPLTVHVRADDQRLLGLDGQAYRRFRTANCGDMTDRATSLRQFAHIDRGDVSVKIWQRHGGYPILREAALRVLASEQITRSRVKAPVRLGRRRAWEYARSWADDTE